MPTTYNPKQVQMTYGGKSIKNGIADGTFITVTRTVPTGSLRVGSDGDGTIQNDPNASATVEITYLAGSATNSILDDFRSSQDGVPSIIKVGTLEISDFNGESEVFDDNAFIVGPPVVSFSTGEEQRTWTIMCPKARINARGSNAAPRIGA